MDGIVLAPKRTSGEFKQNVHTWKLMSAGFILLNIVMGLALAMNWKIALLFLVGCVAAGVAYTKPQLVFLFLVGVLFSDPRSAEHLQAPFFVLDFGGPSLYIYDVILVFLALGLMIRILTKRELIPDIPGGLYVLLFILLSTVGVFVAYYNGFPLFDYRWNIKQGRFILYALTFFITFLAVKNKSDFKRLFSIVNIAAIFLLFYGSTTLISHWGYLVKQQVLGRDPSSVLTLVFLVSLGLFVSLREQSPLRRFPYRLPVIIAPIAAALIVASMSRASILSLFAGFLFFGVLCLLDGKSEVLSIILALIVVGAVASTVISPAIIGFGSNILEEAGNVSRLNQWKTSLKITEKEPIFGLGIGSEYEFFEPASKHVSRMQWGMTHNSFLWLLQKTGIPNIIIFLLIIFIFFKKGISIFLSSKDKYLKGLALGLISYIFAWLVAAFFQDNLIYSRLSILFWLCIALVFIIGSLSEAKLRHLANKGES